MFLSQVLAGAGRQSHFVLALQHVQDGHVVLFGFFLNLGSLHAVWLAFAHRSGAAVTSYTGSATYTQQVGCGIVTGCGANSTK
jgi:hypothetical protein